MHFALSTHAFVAEALTERHVAAFVRSGFRSMELVVAPEHMTIAERDRAEEIQRWLARHGARAVAVHAPIAERNERGVWAPIGTLASTDETQRQHAVHQTRTILDSSDVIPFDHVVVHLGVVGDAGRGSETSRVQACRSLETIAELAAGRGLRVALEVLPNRLSSVEALVDLIEDELDHPHVGICFDTGHAHMQGDVIESLEMASGHLLSVHLNDNRSRRDEHLLPFGGTIDWAATMMTLQKIGYDGPLVLTPAPGRPLDELLDKAQAVTRRLEDLCA